MLCQKCGRQDATVHLTSTVFRQKVEEHLCWLCAGDRAPRVPGGNPKAVSPRRPFSDQSLRDYLEVKSLNKLMSRQEEVAAAKRLESQEPKAIEALCEIPKIGRFVLALAVRLSHGGESFERIVSIKKQRHRALYLKKLPGLVKNLLSTEGALERAWSRLEQGSSRLERRKLLTSIAGLQRQVQRQLPKFFLRPRIFQGYFAELRPAMKSADNLFQEIKMASSMEKKARVVFVRHREIANRLKILGEEQQMDPRAFFRVSQRVKSGYEKANLARGRLTEAHLFIVVAAAKKYSNRGVSFADLVAFGKAGLTRAIERFDYRRAYRFSTFAAMFVDEAMTAQF